MLNVLVTGGAGFIGSHTCLVLLEKGYKVNVIDSFENSSPKALQRVLEIIKLKKNDLNSNLKVFEGDINDRQFINSVFLNFKENNQKIDGVIHFAGLKSVSESLRKPLRYWMTNVLGTINLLDIMEIYNCDNFVFSSSATVYEKKENIRLKETSEINPDSPYGKTKITIEKY